MGKNEYSFLTVDRANERQGERDDDFDSAVAAEARTQAADLLKSLASGAQEALSSFADDWAYRVSQPGVTESLLQLAASDPMAAGRMVANLLQACIDDAAELAALKIVEQH